MAKHCPVKDGPALYLDCMECEDKVCERPVKRMSKRRCMYYPNCKYPQTTTYGTEWVQCHNEKCKERKVSNV